MKIIEEKINELKKRKKSLYDNGEIPLREKLIYVEDISSQIEVLTTVKEQLECMKCKY